MTAVEAPAAPDRNVTAASAVERYDAAKERARALAAARQAKHRAKSAITADATDRLVEALVAAVDRGGQSRLVDNLPEDRAARAEELIRRLATKKIVAFGRGE